MTRQRAYQLRKKALGLCQICGAEANGLTRCPKHFVSNNITRRKREGRNAWEEGKVGKPPKHKID